MPNSYAFVRDVAAPVDEVEAAITKMLDRQPTESDIHPAPRDRFKWARAISAEGRAPREMDYALPWSSFANHEEARSAMTAVVRARLQKASGLVTTAS